MLPFKQFVNKSKKPPYLYHTTSLQGLIKILERKELVSSSEHVSFSERPFLFDISHSQLAIEFKSEFLMPISTEVEYTEHWFNQNREMADYIAGEGWREQFSYEGTMDDNGDIDEDDESRRYEEAALDAFLSKSDEKEWIADSPVNIKIEWIERILLEKKFDSLLPKVKELIANYKIIVTL